MPRLKAIEPDQATGNAKVLLDAVNEKYGMVPNLARTHNTYRAHHIHRTDRINTIDFFLI